MRLLAALVFSLVVGVGCGQRPAPLMPDHLGSATNNTETAAPRALVATLLPTTSLGVEGALVALPDGNRVVFGGAIDRLPIGQYQLSTGSAGGCTNPAPNRAIGEFAASEFGQGKFSLEGPEAEGAASFDQLTVLVQGPLADDDSQAPQVVACGVLEIYAG
ncbi:MAG: hypothetical protein AAFN07_05590 [Pseudomonadota bacterium]